MKSIPSSPVLDSNISIRKNLPWNSMVLLNLENLEFSTAVAINEPKLKPLKFVSIKWHDSNQAFDKLPLSAFSKEQLSNFIPSNSALTKEQFFREQFLNLQFRNVTSRNAVPSKLQF